MTDNNKILITGGAGFIGSHLCDKYAKDGHSVVCLDNFLTGNLMNIRHLLDYRNFKLIKGDIRNLETVEKAVDDVGTIFHLAAQVHVDRSYIEPRLTYEINVLGTQNILDVARMNDTERIIYASSSEVYGPGQYVPMDELHPLDAPHPYGASKTAADRMCYSYMKTYGLNTTILRPFNIFGPRQRDVGYGGVISIFVRRVLSNLPPIVYGDGSQTRDYTYIDDAIEAYDLVYQCKTPLNECINFGTGQEVSVTDLANLIIHLCDKDGEIVPVNVAPRIGEVNRLIADARKAKTMLQWEPAYTLEQGLREYIRWYKTYGFEGRISFE